jgi:hypothetical protein
VWLVARNAINLWALVAVTAFIVPYAILDLLHTQKEAVVIAMVMILVTVASRFRSQVILIATLVIMYSVYGYYIRPYYLLILGAFITLLVLTRASVTVRACIAVAGLIALFCLPAWILGELQGTRDVFFFWKVLQGDVRTGFANPVEPVNAFNFLFNYGYAAMMLHFPFIQFTTARELLLFVNVVFLALLVIAGLRHRTAAYRVLALLFVSHVLVYVLFEPDLGSYFRHLASIALYVLISLRSPASVPERLPRLHRMVPDQVLLSPSATVATAS